MTDCELDKWIWTENDYEQMGWHDSTVYGFQLNQNLVFDIDYILQWNEPDIEGFHFTFWVAPATLVFERPTELAFDLTQSFEEDTWIEIDDIEMEIAGSNKIWTIITRQGDITFKADSFKQVFRRPPSYQLGQRIPYDERGGFSFEISPGDQLKEKLSSHIIERRTKQFKDYELAKTKFRLIKELENLREQRLAGQIDSKDFLIEMKEMKAKIDMLTLQLHNTQYENM